MTKSITLTASMRANLASLKGIQKQMDTTQTRLSTGKKVNSAIDNASSFYQSRALTNRAADLNSLLDSMGQGIQTIQAANSGIESITAFIDQAKSVATSAFSLDSTAADYVKQVDNYQEQFNKIREEIDKLAKDSSYQGVNLLTGSKLTVMFNETRTHFLDVQGKNVYNEMADASVGFTDAAWTDGDVTAAAVVTADGEVTAAKAALETTATTGYVAVDNTNFATKLAAANTEVYVQSTNAHGTKSWTKVATTATYDSTKTYMSIGGSEDLLADGKEALENYEKKVDAYEKAVTASIAGTINASLDGISKAIDYLRDYSSELGNNFSIIETRQNFTEALVDVLETGSDNLVLADMNEESANYLALQTRQQLAINSLALASQSAQSVLKLF